MLTATCCCVLGPLVRSLKHKNCSAHTDIVPDSNPLCKNCSSRAAIVPDSNPSRQNCSPHAAILPDSVVAQASFVHSEHELLELKKLYDYTNTQLEMAENHLQVHLLRT